MLLFVVVVVVAVIVVVVVVRKTRGFFYDWVESHDGGSEISGLHPFLKKKMSR